MSLSAAARPVPPAPTSAASSAGWAGTLVDGTRAVVAGPVGDVVPGTAHGLYADGRRLLDRLELQVGLGALVPTGSETVGAEARYGLVIEGADGEVLLEVERRRTLGAGPGTAPGALLTDRLTLTSRADRPIAMWVRVVVGGDGATVAEVRAGLVAGGPASTPHRPRAVAGRDEAVVLDDDLHRLGVSQHPGPTALSGHDGVALLESDVVLPPGEPVTLVVTAVLERRVAPEGVAEVVAEPGPAGVDWETVGIAADDHRLVTAVGHAIDDLRHLLVRDPLAPDDVVAVAAAPWHQTLDPREALWAARLTLPFGVDLALGTLRALARRQVHLPAEEAEAGRGPDAGASSASPAPIPSPDVAEVTALWICLLGEARLWGMADHRVRELLPALRLAVSWIRGQVEGGFLVDPPDARAGAGAEPGPVVVDRLRWRDLDQVDGGPLTRLEVQTGAVEALRVAARIYDDLQIDGAAELEVAADDLSARVRARFWSISTEGPRLAAALDADGSPVIADSSSLALTLGTGALTDEESRLVVDLVLRQALIDPLGMRVTRSGHVRPDKTGLVAWSLLRAGFVDHAAPLALALVDASEVFGHQWPEVFVGGVDGRPPARVTGAASPTAVGAAAFAVVLQAALGLTVDARAGWVRVHPPTAAPFGRVDVTGFRFRGHPFRVTVGADRRVEAQGLPSDVVLHHPHAEARPS